MDHSDKTIRILTGCLFVDPGYQNEEVFLREFILLLDLMKPLY